jgi:hypothetical protein
MSCSAIAIAREAGPNPTQIRSCNSSPETFLNLEVEDVSKLPLDPTQHPNRLVAAMLLLSRLHVPWDRLKVTPSSLFDPKPISDPLSKGYITQVRGGSAVRNFDKAKSGIDPDLGKIPLFPKFVI